MFDDVVTKFHSQFFSQSQLQHQKMRTTIRYHPFANYQEMYNIRDMNMMNEALNGVITRDSGLFQVYITPTWWTRDEFYYFCHSLANSERDVYVRNDGETEQLSNMIFVYNPFSEMEATLPVQQEKKKNMTRAEFKRLIGREKFLIREAKKVGGDLSCSICLEKFRSGSIVAKTSCAHRFHIRCLKNYFCDHGGTCCPMCRCDQMPEVGEGMVAV